MQRQIKSEYEFKSYIYEQIGWMNLFQSQILVAWGRMVEAHTHVRADKNSIAFIESQRNKPKLNVEHSEDQYYI